jgi:hypothetical protein
VKAHHSIKENGMSTSENAPDLTLIAKNASLADAFVTVLDEGLEAWKTLPDGEREHPSADGRMITIPWAGRLSYAMGIAKLAIMTGVATEEDTQAMLDRAAAWDTGLPLPVVIEMRERVEAEQRKQRAAKEPDLEALLGALFGPDGTPPKMFG